MITYSRVIALILTLAFFAFNLKAQTPKTNVLAVTSRYSDTVRGNILTWTGDGALSATAQLEIQRRNDTAGANYQRLAILALNTGRWVDTSARPGMVYDYQLRTVNSPQRGYLTAGYQIAPTTKRGRILVVVEQSMADSLRTEIKQLVADYRADGLLPTLITIAATQTPPQVKALIKRAWQQHSNDEHSVLLLGRVAVPYSGFIVPDGHQEHKGAWPTDLYYGDIDGIWTDSVVNSTTARRDENKNVARDGKFDQDELPSTLEMPVMRVSMHRLGVYTNSRGPLGEYFLTRRYLRKLHAFKMAEFVPERRGFIDDNFGFFGGEAFAASGWHSFQGLFGANRTHLGDWAWTPINNGTWLFAYGCGGGSYNVALDVASSADLARDSARIVFSMLFGSYFGDWDSDNNLMRAALASRGWMLSCSWSGRPVHLYHDMGIGHNLGRVLMDNANLGNTTAGVHLAILGDPSLRLHYPKPVARVSAVVDLRGNLVKWSPSLDATNGYLVYRASSDTGAFELITPTPVSDTVFADQNSPIGRSYYQVKVVRLETVSGGSYFNQSLGLRSNVVDQVVRISAKAKPLVQIYPNPVRANEGAVTITTTHDIEQAKWVKENGQNSYATIRKIEGGYNFRLPGHARAGRLTLRVKTKGGIWISVPVAVE